MSFATLSGIPIQSGDVTFKASGAWEAGLFVDAEAVAPAVGDAVTIEAPGMQLAGTVTLAGTDSGGQSSVRVVGGAAKLTDIIPPRSLTVTTVRDVLGSILKDAGEAASPLIDATLLARPLPRWVRARGDAVAALDALAKALGVVWRVLDDGGVWLGTDAGEANEATVDVTAERPDEDTVEIAPEVLSFRPGQTFKGGPVAMVTYDLGAKTRATISRTGAGNGFQRLAKKQADKAAAATKLHPPTGAKVVGQNGDGSLELQVESPDMPALSRVPIRHGIPGVTRIELAVGTRVWVQFERGDEQKPYACLFVGGRTTKVIWDGDHFEWGGDEAVAMSVATNLRLSAIEAYLAIPGPVIGPAPLVPVPLASTTLFAKPGP
jgi:hypothetical protein